MRSSIARQLGLDVGRMIVSSRDVDGIAAMLLNRLLGELRGYLSSSKYAKLAKCSTDSALRDIRELVDRGILVRNPGGGRSTSYRLATIEELEVRSTSQ